MIRPNRRKILMKSRIGRPSPALVISIVALVFAMVGTGYAAFKVPKKSVGTKQLKANAVTNAKVKNETLTGKKIKLSTLGIVPNASHATLADTATIANSLPTPELHVIGAPGQPGFQSGTTNYGSEESGITFTDASFFKSHDNVVHLEGIVKVGAGGPIPGEVYQLPPGFRPPSGKVQYYETLKEQPVLIFGSNVNISGQDVSGEILTTSGKAAVLSGIVFRAES
jgi:hypothetical protein